MDISVIAIFQFFVTQIFILVIKEGAKVIQYLSYWAPGKSFGELWPSINAVAFFLPYNKFPKLFKNANLFGLFTK